MDTESKKEEIRHKALFLLDMKSETKKELIIYGSIILAIILIRTFIVTPVRVNGTSMYSTLNDGEIMILNKINYKFTDIKRFDIVVVKTENNKIIKRVIGLPGETLKYEDNVLYINGQEVKESYLKEKTEDFNINELGYKKIPQDCYFVMGDNRDNSNDSRIIGCVKREQIKGKTSLVIFPFKNAGYKN